MKEHYSGRRFYPSDVSDDEWEFVAPYVTLMDEEAPQREYALRDLFNAVRWIVRTGAPWRYLPNDFPPWHAVYQQMRRWMAAKVFEDMVHDLRSILRMCVDREADPTAVIFDGRTMQSTPESGERAGYDGHKRKKGSKVHLTVDTLGHLLALCVTPANEQQREQVAALSLQVQQATGQSVELAYVDQGYTGDRPAEAAAPRDPVGSDQTHTSQTGIRALTAALGGRAQLCVARSIPTPGTGLRTAFRDARSDALHPFTCLMLKNLAAELVKSA